MIEEEIERELQQARSLAGNVGKFREVSQKQLDKRRKASKVARKQRKRNRNV